MAELIKLKEWDGTFNESTHEYFTSDGVQLQGVTGMLRRRIFKDEYKGVSQEVLMNAAERGHLVHSQCEFFDLMGVGTEIPEVYNYSNLIKENNLEHVATEYLISDDEHYASAIDKVFHPKDGAENEFILADIKTTYNFNSEYVSWQLSVYAKMFEEMNPNAKVVGLKGIWLREDARRGSIHKMYDIERKPAAIVEELISCDIEDREFNGTVIPQYISDNIDELRLLTERAKEIEERKKEIVGEILKNMQSDNIQKCDVGTILITRKAGAVRTTFDTKRFKEEHEDLYDTYVKTSTSAESLQITLR